jgi:hypothetical protein
VEGKIERACVQDKQNRLVSLCPPQLLAMAGIGASGDRVGTCNYTRVVGNIVYKQCSDLRCKVFRDMTPCC